MEKLFTQNNVVNNIEKIKCMAKYCSRNVVHILKGMANYTTPDWPLLDQQHHREYNLKKLTNSWRKTHIWSMTNWCQYLHEFTKIAGWLVNHRIIDKDTAAHYMWKGLHISLCSLVEDQLLAQDPTYSDSDDSTDSQVSNSDDDLPPWKKSKAKTRKQVKVKCPATPIAPAPACGPKLPRTTPAVTTSSDWIVHDDYN
ncbi:hypothetical protein C8F04DRAFT_1190641 [Mycena alexandri]|uniref:Uncharacterized protein n=1 Tax=Mycena alexandri TaxID=1745969 RepID=A0AAD6SER6_9AGAR|nr:hypothetical protein C8F04DRAFT_1190641 [Mycena alexandri]